MDKLPRLLALLCGWLLGAVLFPGGTIPLPAQEPDPYAPFVAGTPPLEPQEQLKKFHLPPGFEIQLVAAEPQIAKPINLTFDRHGRLYATCTLEYPFPVPEGTPGRDFVARITIAPGGKAAQVERVVTGLNIPIGVEPVEERLLVWSIPAVSQYRDRDGDGRYESGRKLLTGFEYRDTHGMINSLSYWVDGWVYACHGYANRSRAQGQDGSQIVMHSGNTFRFRPGGARLEHFTFGQVNPFGLAWDRWGQLYSADCHSRPAYLLLPGAYYPSFGRPHDGLGFGPELMRHSHGSTAIAGVACYLGEQFPEEFRHNLFIGNPVTGRVNRDRLLRRGASYRGEEMPDLLRCDDPWFRPVDVELGPDGALYIADFYNRIIGHYEVPLDHPGRDRHRGRIWRIVYTGPKPHRPASPPPDLTRQSTARLVENLGHANLTLVRLSVHELAARRAEEVMPLVQRLFAAPSAPQQRAFALWVLVRHGRLSPQRVQQALKDPQPLVRVHALRVLGELPWRGKESLWPEEAVPRRLVHQALKDPHPLVCRVAAEVLSRHRSVENLRPLLALWRRTPEEDAYLVHSVRIALRDQLLVPGAYEQLKQLFAGDEDAEERLAQLSLGVARPQAALYLRQRLRQRPPLRWPEPWLTHTLRYLPPGELSAWSQEIAARLKEQEALLRLKLLEAAHQGYRQRGRNWPRPLARLALGTIEELLDSGDSFRRTRALRFAERVRPGQLVPRLEQMIQDDRLDPTLRGQAVQALAAIQGAKCAPVLFAVLEDGQAPLGLRQKVAHHLGTFSQAVVRKRLLKSMEQLPQGVSRVAAGFFAWDARWAPRLLEAVAAGRVDARVLQDRHVQNGIYRAAPQLKEKMKELLRGLPSPDEKLRRNIREVVQLVQQGRADPRQGKTLFEKHCQACHRLRNQGTKVGPELDGVGHRGPWRLAEDLLDPSARVDQAFRATQVLTTGGQVLTGLKLADRGELVVLVNAEGKQVEVPRSRIQAQQVLPLSPMPGNFAQVLSRQQVADLLSFLLQQRQAVKEPSAGGK